MLRIGATSARECVLGEVCGGVDCYQVMSYFIEHCYTGYITSCFKSLPIKMIKHRGDTGFVVMPVSYISRSTSLHIFKFFNVGFSMWGPDRRAVFKVRPNK